MRRIRGQWHHSPQDVLAVLECEHRLVLERGAAYGLIERPEETDDATLALIARHGLAHEAAALDALKTLVHGDLLEIDAPGTDVDALHAAADATRAALTAGVGAVYQAVLLVDGFVGYADFLTSVHPVTGAPLLTDDGRRRYEPVDAKLARSAKPAALLQTACYADALERLGHPPPHQVHVWLGDGRVQSWPAADLVPLVHEYRERVLAHLAAPPTAPVPSWADARTACGTCRWAGHCDAGRRAADDLSLVANIRGDQVRRLRDRGIATVAALAGASDAHRLTGMGPDTFVRLRAQAQLQHDGHGEENLLVDVFDPAGSTRCPPPTPATSTTTSRATPSPRAARGWSTCTAQRTRTRTSPPSGRATAPGRSAPSRRSSTGSPPPPIGTPACTSTTTRRTRRRP